MADDYNALVAARKSCRICVERSPGRIRSCAEFEFDPEVVSHWEQWLGHRNPKLLVIGQDFGNVGYFVRHRGRDDPHNKTNGNLRKLLAEAGFMTNSILCLKEGKMSTPIRSSWVAACTERHLQPLLRLLRPPVVVGMGGCGWQAVRQAFALDNAPRLVSQALGSEWLAADRTRVFAAVHCGPLGLTNRGWLQQIADWQRIGEAVAMISGQLSSLTRRYPASTTTDRGI